MGSILELFLIIITMLHLYLDIVTYVICTALFSMELLL